jgi:hypothetical protein
VPADELVRHRTALVLGDGLRFLDLLDSLTTSCWIDAHGFKEANRVWLDEIFASRRADRLTIEELHHALSSISG